MNMQHWRRLPVRVALGALGALAPALGAQQVSTRRPAVERERILVRIDSLMWEFDHAPLSAEQSESLRVQMSRAMHELAPAMAYSYRMEMAPQGYLGVTFDGPSVELPRGSERVIRFLDYPRVSMVEPGSPAERGGVARGDTLIALNGLDVKDREISLTKMLVPARRITVRVLRDGRARELRVTVDTSPEYMARRMVAMAPMPAMTPMPPEPAVAATSPAMTYAMPTAPTPPGVKRVAPVMVMPDIEAWSDAEGVAGARLVAVTEGLGRALGVNGGVLVLRASPGTPAFASGLRDGDIIVRVGGKTVSAVQDVRRAAMNGDGEEGVPLVVLRQHRRRTVTLRW